MRLYEIDVRILGDEYREKPFTGREYCESAGIRLHFNERRHRFSSTNLRLEVFNKENLRLNISQNHK